MSTYVRKEPHSKALPLEMASSAAGCCEHGDKPSRSINGGELRPEERESVSYVGLIISPVI